MSGMNRSVFCLACGEIIAESNLAAHIAANPDHAFIKYHHNLPTGGGDPVGAIISGSLNGSTRLHVDGSRTDTDTPETGTPAQPFRTIQAAVDYGVATFAGPFTLCIEQALYVEEVVMPDFVTIDCPVGAILRRPPGPTPSDALTVTGTDGDPEPVFGATIIRGLRVVSDGDDGSGGFVESWCLRVVGDNSGGPGNTREPFVVVHVCSFDAYNQGNYLYNQGGAFFLTGDGGTGGDGTGGVGVKLKPLPDMGAMCLCSTQMISFGSIGLDIYENSFFVGNGTRFQAHGGPLSAASTCIQMDATAGFSLVSIYQPSQMFGDPQHFIKAAGPPPGGPGGPGGLITLHGGYNDIFDGVGLDAVGISGSILFRFVDGGIRSAGGRGIVLNDALMWIRNANVVSGDGLALEAVGDDCHVDSIDTTYEGHVAGGAYGPCVEVDIYQPTVSFTGGRMRGDGTVLNLLRGSMFLLGGVDLDPQNPASVAYNVAAGAQLQRGHCNVRRGQRIVAVGASENLLPSGFGELEVGFFNSIARIVSSLTAPPGGSGYEQGSLWIWPGNGVYQNIGSEAVPDWELVGGASAVARDRVQLGDTPQVNLNAVPEATPIVIPFASTDYNDDPPFDFLGAGIVELAEDGNYLLSFNLPFETDNVILLQGSSCGACWEWSDDDGASWNKILRTESWDTVVGIEHDSGTINLPPVEVTLTAGLWLRVAGWQDPFVCDAYINRNDAVDRAWARIEREHVGMPTSALIHGAGNPNGSVTGVAGQMYRDTSSGLYYICRSNGLMIWDLL